MKLTYGLEVVSLNSIDYKDYIKIHYKGNFRIFCVNKSFILYRTKNIIKLLPRRNFNPDSSRLFRYKGNIKIDQAYIGKEKLIIDFPYDEHWLKLTSDWDTLTLEWSDYIMSHKVNTLNKRIAKKGIIDNELQHIF